MEPREIEVCAVVGGRDVDPATIEQHLGLTGNYNWRRRDGDDVEWGVRHVVHTLFLTEPVEFVLDLIEGVGDQWRKLAETHEDWEFSLICTVDMSDAFLSHEQFPVLALSHSVIARIGSLGLEFDIVFK